MHFVAERLLRVAVWLQPTDEESVNRWFVA